MVFIFQFQVPHEPIKRRLHIDGVAQKFRKVLTEIKWVSYTVVYYMKLQKLFILKFYVCTYVHSF